MNKNEKCCASCLLFEKFTWKRKKYYKGNEGQCNLHKKNPRLVQYSDDGTECNYYKYKDYIAEKIIQKGW